MGELTCTLTKTHADDITRVGGKGANLGKLARAGLPAPLAFCVTTDSYRRHIEARPLTDRISGTVQGLHHQQAEDVAIRSAAIRAMIMEAPIPAEIEAAIRSAYAELEARCGANLSVSLRSSATAEDLPGTSFAGQQDTYLHVAGAENVQDYDKRCWASLWTDRAVAYRHRRGFRHEDVFLAVVVQEVFPSQVAGVLFTATR